MNECYFVRYFCYFILNQLCMLVLVWSEQDPSDSDLHRRVGRAHFYTDRELKRHLSCDHVQLHACLRNNRLFVFCFVNELRSTN